MSEAEKVQPGTQDRSDVQTEPCDHSLNFVCSVPVFKLKLLPANIPLSIGQQTS
jgi:hypothetical protein